MKFYVIVIGLFAILLSIGCQSDQNLHSSRKRLFDDGWKFFLGNPLGAEKQDFDDSNWRSLDLPHDWSIEDLEEQISDSIIGPFSKASVGKMSTGYTVGGTGWYRKTFTLNDISKGKVLYLHFDGIYMNADVWFNGHHLGNHLNGYTSFYYNVTPYLNDAGETNVVAVRVKNEGQNTRWYSGSGIYRHTWITIVDPVHIDVWGVSVTTPSISDSTAEISLSYTLKNDRAEDQSITVKTEIIDPSGNISTIAEKEVVLSREQKTTVSQCVIVMNPALWSVDFPSLYKAKVTLFSNSKINDEVTTTFGIRSVKIDAQTGFSLNGKQMEIKGGNFHHDNGPLGAAAIDRAEERKIELLKKAGYNAIRCSHNPPSPQLLDVCDRLGILVIVEVFDVWTKPKRPDDYSNYFRDNWKDDLTSMVQRDRNHPSVFMWSIGNEIPEAREQIGIEIAGELAAFVRKLDPTRPVTEALVDFKGLLTSEYISWDDVAQHMAKLDVVGYNYGYNKYEKDHDKYPERIIYSSESMPALMLHDWQMVEKLPFVFGSFTWTAMDYIGEAGIGVPRLIDKSPSRKNKTVHWMNFFDHESWPFYNGFTGDLDLVGNPKSAWYYRQVVWRESNLEILVHQPIPAGKEEIVSPWGFPNELRSWNWKGHEGEKMLIHVYSRGPVVRLELNGKIVGEQTIDDNKSITASFEVPYEAGELTARSFSNDTETDSQSLKTTGQPYALKLVADRNRISANKNDLSYVMVEVVDQFGNLVPDADSLTVEFTITGNGELAGVGNGSHSDMASFQQPVQRTWQGKCLAIVRPTGTSGIVTLSAKAEGLRKATIEINVESNKK